MNRFGALRTVVAVFLTDDCTINAPSAVNYDPDTLTYTDTAGDEVYSGSCRIRPASGPSDAEAGESVRTLHGYDGWLPHTADVERDQILTVTDSDDPYLVGRAFRIVDVQGGSEGAHRKLRLEDVVAISTPEAGS